MVKPSMVSQATPTGRKVLEGRVEDVPLSDILQVLQVSGKTGALILKRPDGPTATIVLRNGQMAQAVTSDEEQTLGNRLLQSGVVSKQNLTEALSYLARFPGMRLADTLVDTGWATRKQVEDAIKAHMAETIDRVTSWNDARFEFQMETVSPGEQTQESATEFTLDQGVEPRQVLLQASVFHDHRRRDLDQVPGELQAEPESSEGDVTLIRKPKAPTAGGTQPDASDALRSVQWFDWIENPRAREGGGEREKLRAAEQFFALNEELVEANERGETGLLLLRYASEGYAHGALILREADGFRVLGQFGAPFQWGSPRPSKPKVVFRNGECPLFELVTEGKQSFMGLAALTGDGNIAPAGPRTPGAVISLVIPLVVVGRVNVILFCRTALPGAPDAHGLIALARQVALAMENLELRKVTNAKEPAG